MNDCAPTIRTWNQVRPGVFDGGYAFYNIPSGNYITEVVPPTGYKVQKEEDKNVVFGDVFTPSTQSVLVLPPECVGDARNKVPAHIVPQYLSLFPDKQVPAFRAGEETPLCTMKRSIQPMSALARSWDPHGFRSPSRTGPVTKSPGSILTNLASTTPWYPPHTRSTPRSQPVYHRI
jgi:hypothetical protein